MPRIARVVAVDYPHHITQRGNYQQKTFKNKKDFLRYLKWVEEYCQKYLLSLLAYTLMPTHVHFIGIPRKEDSLAKSFKAIHGRYAQFFNRKHNQRGHLWQDRFYSCVLDEKHLYFGVKYVERNPVEAGLVKKPWDWKWSSALTHVKGLKGKDLNGVTLADINELMEIDSWKEYLEKENEKEVIEKIEKCTLSGRPLGEKEFVHKIESIYKRELTILLPGRPKGSLNKGL